MGIPLHKDLGMSTTPSPADSPNTSSRGLLLAVGIAALSIVVLLGAIGSMLFGEGGGGGELTGFDSLPEGAYFLEVTGSAEGDVYGTTVYGSNSDLPATAVHAGVLEPGEKAIIQVNVFETTQRRAGSRQNGIQSADAEPTAKSIRLESTRQDLTRFSALTSSFETFNAENLAVGDIRYLYVDAKAAAPIWGTNVYTADSSLEAAVVHAGLLKDGETGYVKVTVLPGQRHYQGTTRNGVKSEGWFSDYHLSFRVDLAPEPEETVDEEPEKEVEEDSTGEL